MHSPDGAHGSASLTLPMLTMNPPSETDSFLAVASNLLPGAELLCTVKEVPPHPVAFLCCHVLECTLKAALILRFGSWTHVGNWKLKREKSGHDLRLLWRLVEQNFLHLPIRRPAWLSTLSKMHKAPYHLRYAPGLHAMTFPKLSDIPRELRILLEWIQQMQRDDPPRTAL